MLGHSSGDIISINSGHYTWYPGIACSMGQLYALLCLGMPYSGDISNNYDHIHHALLDGATGDHVVPRVRYLAEDGESVPWQQV
jgi:hypothetical protein